MAYVYILRCDGNRYYVGSAVDLQKRLKHHDRGLTPSTKRLGNCHLVLSQEYETLIDARLVEGKIKKLKRKDYIARMVKDGVIKVMPR
ncbi:MAG: GIY-YIG nuclease family protein [Patescibacteria group bacterium]|nr:GIY-YIG nuclease family protein [Patescibacteria group bacterium]